MVIRVKKILHLLNFLLLISGINFIVAASNTTSTDTNEESFIRSENKRYHSNIEASPKLCDPTDSKRMLIINEYIKDNKDYLSKEDVSLIKFIAGDCLPVVLVPGFYGTKFQLHITNCTALNEFHPEIAKACKFDTKCKDNTEEFFWLSESFERNDGTTCFGELSKINIVKNETETDPSKKFKEMPNNGFRLVYRGNTPETEKESECGFGATTNLLDKFYYFGTKSLRGQLDMKIHFESLGYQIGLNLFTIPYDWRKMSNDPYSQELMKSTVDLAYKLTGKKVVVMGHSFGSLVALDYIYSLSDEEREKKIDRLVAVGPAFGGVSTIVKSFILGYEEFNIDVKFIVQILSLYLSVQNQKITAYKNTGLFILFQKAFWNLHQNDEFMTVVRNRTQVEDKITECVRDYFRTKKLRFLETETEKIELKEKQFGAFAFFEDTNSNSIEDEVIKSFCIDPILTESKEVLSNFKRIFPFYPALEIGCSIQNMAEITCIDTPNCKQSIWDKYCRLNFLIPYDTPMIKIRDGDEDFSFDLLTKESVYKLLQKFSLGEPDMEFFNWVYDSINPSMEKLNHPKVPVTVYFNTGFKTTTTFDLPKNPKPITDENKFVVDVLGQDIVKKGGGDGCVTSTSLILPPLKWTVEDAEKKYPIHLVDYCSDANVSKKEVDFNDHQYLKINCRCNQPNVDGCTHSSMVGDENLIKHMTLYAVNEKNRLSDQQLLQEIDLVGKSVNQVEKNHKCSNLKQVNEKFH